MLPTKVEINLRSVILYRRSRNGEIANLLSLRGSDSCFQHLTKSLAERGAFNSRCRIRPSGRVVDYRATTSQVSVLFLGSASSIQPFIPTAVEKTQHAQMPENEEGINVVVIVRTLKISHSEELKAVEISLHYFEQKKDVEDLLLFCHLRNEAIKYRV
ncbi:hypothetical protein TNCV_1705541 [Trichonephila clavipes]|uniref:Uncharacterized protein n=1 Tax=Trichonephila clavipes TaxID=2585209 RepID=A0A8X6UUM7_TRICX|nr:hypothetical protein TNCV_1705541 [Trichonephila clavipes]